VVTPRGIGSVGCPSCGRYDLSLLFTKYDFPVLECRTCELRFAPAEHTEDSLRALYSEGYFVNSATGYLHYVHDEDAHRRQARRYLARLGRAGIRPGRLLDVGCAAGYFADEARKVGWQVVGCDISEYATRHAERLGIRVIRGDFVSADFGGEVFDLITLFNVIEHLPEPRRVATKLYRLLKPGGVLAVETWDRDSMVARVLGRRWHQYTPPYVLSYFNRGSLRHLFDPEHWKLRSYHIATKWITLRRGLSILGGLAGTGLVAELFGWLGGTRVGSVEVPYFLGDLIFSLFERL